MKNDEKLLGHGALPDPIDERDYIYNGIAAAGQPITDEEWEKGFDIEKELGFKLPIKNQFSSLSCIGQAFGYYAAVIDLKETGKYDEVSAKAIYSQIYLSNGGAYFRDAAKLLVDFGALYEALIASYKADGTTDEQFMRDKSWITPEVIELAKILAAKEYRSVTGYNINIFAQAIRDNLGMVAGVTGCNNGTWRSEAPVAPTLSTPQSELWGHALYYGRFGKDSRGKWIGTPNSWGNMGYWQKIYEDEWFKDSGRWVFSPWTLIDKPNQNKINSITMITIKKQGEPAVYAAVGDILIPFSVSWANYQKEFDGAKIIELTPAEFAKYKVASTLAIKLK